MTGKTHRVGGVLCALGGYTYLSSKGLLIRDVSPILQLAVMYPFALYGSVFSDLDHHWDSAPCKDIVSYGVNKVLHLATPLRKATDKEISTPLKVFDAKHRSWQTHSDLFLFIVIGLMIALLGGNYGTANDIIVKLVGTGFVLGLLSHLILDMLTPEGVWSVVLCGIKYASNGGKVKNYVSCKVHLVPKSKFFATGGSWESFVRWFMWLVSFVLLAGILYSMCPYKLEFLL